MSYSKSPSQIGSYCNKTPDRRGEISKKKQIGERIWRKRKEGTTTIIIDNQKNHSENLWSNRDFLRLVPG